MKETYNTGQQQTNCLGFFWLNQGNFIVLDQKITSVLHNQVNFLMYWHMMFYLILGFGGAPVAPTFEKAQVTYVNVIPCVRISVSDNGRSIFIYIYIFFFDRFKTFISLQIPFKHLLWRQAVIASWARSRANRALTVRQGWDSFRYTQGSKEARISRGSSVPQARLAARERRKSREQGYIYSFSSPSLR